MKPKTGEGGKTNNPGQGEDWSKMARDAIYERTKREIQSGDNSEELNDLPDSQWEQAAGIKGLGEWRKQLYALRGYLGYEDEMGKTRDELLESEHERVVAKRKEIQDYNVEIMRIMRKGEDGEEVVFPRRQGESLEEYKARLMEEAAKESGIISYSELAQRIIDKSEDGLYNDLIQRYGKEKDESNEDYAARISYEAEKARLRKTNPNQPGEDDSTWRARIGLTDGKSWVRQERSRAKAHELYESMQEAVPKIEADAQPLDSVIEAEYQDDINKKLREMMPRMLGEKPEAYEARLENALAQVRSISELTFEADDIRNSEGSKREKYKVLRSVTEKYPQLDGESLPQYRDRLLYLVIDGADGVDLAAIDAKFADGDNHDDNGNPDDTSGDSGDNHDDDPNKGDSHDDNPDDNGNPDDTSGDSGDNHDDDPNKGDKSGDSHDDNPDDKMERIRKKFGDLIDNDDEFNKFLGEKNIVLSDTKKLSDEEREKLIEEYEKRRDKKEKPEEEGESYEMKSVVAAELDIDKDIEDAIRAEAAEKHTEFLKEGGFIRRLVWGSMFKEVSLVRYEKAIRKEYEEGKRTLDKSGIERFTMAYTRSAEDALIHDKAGERYSAYSVKSDEDGEYVERRYVDENGEMKTERVDKDNEMAQNTIKLRDLVQQYAKGEIDEKKFRAEVDAMRRSENENGDRVYSIENYVEAAKAARENIEHGFAIENVMEGFAYINGEARRNVRTEEHRDSLDRITHSLMRSRIGRWVPPEAIALGTSLVMTFGKSTLSASFAFGGVAVSGVLAGAKERSRVTTERSVAQRRIAQGGELGDTKYDKQMTETIQEMVPAESITSEFASIMSNLENSELSEEDRKLNQERLLQQYGMAEAAVSISDSEGIDLIRYANGENATIEDQRIAMDIMRAQARKMLREQGVTDEQFSKTIEAWSSNFRTGNEELEMVGLDDKEKAFRKLRRKRVAKKTAIAVGMGLATTIGVEEARAAIDDDIHGIFDHLTGHRDNAGASETVLANMFGMHQDSETISTVVQQGIDEATAKQLESEGYTITQAGTRTELETVAVSKNEFLEANGESVTRRWLNNDTSVYDGNELGIHVSDSGGFETHMSGFSTRAGEQVNFDGGNDIVGFLTLNRGDAPIQIEGEIVNGQVDFSKGLEELGLGNIGAEGNYQWFEVGRVTGTATDGTLNVDVFATSTGHGFGGDMIQTVTEREVPIFDAISVTENAGSEGIHVPFAVVPPTSRRGITFGRRGGTYTPISERRRPEPSPEPESRITTGEGDGDDTSDTSGDGGESSGDASGDGSSAGNTSGDTSGGDSGASSGDTSGDGGGADDASGDGLTLGGDTSGDSGASSGDTSGDGSSAGDTSGDTSGDGGGAGDTSGDGLTLGGDTSGDGRSAGDTSGDGRSVGDTSGDVKNDLSNGEFYKYMGLSEPISKDSSDLSLLYRQASDGSWSMRGLENEIRRYAYEHDHITDEVARRKYAMDIRSSIRAWGSYTPETQKAILEGTQAMPEEIKFLEQIGLIRIG